MEKLIQGIHDFQKMVFGDRQKLFERLASGQKPEALFITCSDSRIDPNLLTQTEPGELFILRNAGNIVPPYGIPGGEAATIEYAVEVLQVKDIVICGHSHCGAMGGLLNWESLASLPSVREWLQYAQATARVVEEKYKHLTGDAERLMAAVQVNSLVQVDNLRTHPCVAGAVAAGKLNLHAWTYEFEIGKVHSYDPVQNEYMELQLG